METYYSNETGTSKSYPSNSATPCKDYFVTATPQIISSVLYDPFNAAGNEYQLFTNGNYYVFVSLGPAGDNFNGFAIGPNGAVTEDNKTTTHLCVTNGSGC
ncbi:MAG: hypothetical protein HQL13_03635, partial [Candidatus Omnitrophica bacterium]|nr:hypothetical protein [Candidatus Omnitrophota bacterium]